jgi:NADH:ubiquinone oxidoreductase subunit E
MARLSPENVELAQQIIARYPRPKSATIPLCHLAQEQDGYLADDAMAHVAELVGCTSAEVLGTASFYEMFKRHRTGKFCLNVCTNISCWLRGADEMIQEMCEQAGTAPGETSEDGKLFVRGFECLGACDLAPMASIDGEYFGPLEPGEGAEAIAQLRASEKVLPKRRLEDRGAAGGKRAGADRRTSSHPMNKIKAKPRAKRARKA